MNKNSGELVEGELFDESFDFKHITWKISNALSLPDLVDYKVQSGTFSFAGADWKLAMFPYGQTYYGTEGYIDLNLVRLSSTFPEHSVFYKFCFKTVHGKEFESYSDSTIFDSEMSAGGVGRYLKKSKFMNKRNFLAPNAVLTIMCQMRTKKIVAIDSFAQTESTPSLLDDSPKQTFKQEPESSASTSEACNSTLKNPGAFSGVTAFTEKMIQDFKQLFLKQEDCDVIIKVKGQEFQAHRAILRARSPVFASTFRNDMKEKATGIVEIEDCDPSSFSDFLCFLYSGAVENLSTENVFSLFTTADKYDIQDLRSECLEFMKKNLSISTFCNTITLALRYSEEGLVQLCTSFLAKNLKEVIMTVEWQSLLIENPILCNEIMIKSLKSNEC